MEDAGCSVPGLYLAKNLGLNMTDDYWLRPDGSGLEYKHVKGSGAVKPPYDPNVSLGGQMGKYWILAPDRPILVKEARRHHGQQAVNEAFAVWIHERQGTNAPFVRYHGTMMGGGWAACRCGTFALENVEFVPAYEILESWKGQNSLSPYENYIKACIQYGIERSMIQDFMDYQTMTDFVISNMDRHRGHYEADWACADLRLGGQHVLRRGKGDSVQPGRAPGAGITSFYKTEEGMLRKVKGRSLARVGLLPKTSEVRELYQSAGIPEWKAEVISLNYELKVQMLKEFQRWMTISLYHEREREKEGNDGREDIER